MLYESIDSMSRRLNISVSAWRGIVVRIHSPDVIPECFYRESRTGALDTCQQHAGMTDALCSMCRQEGIPVVPRLHRHSDTFLVGICTPANRGTGYLLTTCGYDRRLVWLGSTGRDSR